MSIAISANNFLMEHVRKEAEELPKIEKNDSETKDSNLIYNLGPRRQNNCHARATLEKLPRNLLKVSAVWARNKSWSKLSCEKDWIY